MPKVKSNLKPGTHWQDVHFHSHVMMDALAKEKEQRGLRRLIKIFFDFLVNCEKEYKCFDTESTAQHHVQMGGYQVGSEFIGDWIAGNL